MTSLSHEDKVLYSFKDQAQKLYNPSKQEVSDSKILSLFTKTVGIKGNKELADDLADIASVYISPNKLLFSIITLNSVSDDLVVNMFFAAVGFITEEELKKSIALIRVNRYPLFEEIAGKIFLLTDLEYLFEELAITPAQA